LRQGLGLARDVSDVRSELLVQLIMSTSMQLRGQPDAAERHARHSNNLASQLGARRFQAEGLCVLATSHLARGEREEAMQVIVEALQLARLTGMNYCGPILLGVLARATSDPGERSAALQEAEGLLADGCVSHSYFEFYYHAIEVSLLEGAWADAHRYADALADYVRDEPVAWTELVVRRGRTLAEVGNGQVNHEVSRSLEELRTTCRRLGLLLPLPGIDEALAKLAMVQA
jgi:hypothetical protein